jgi:hypothetical protein
MGRQEGPFDYVDGGIAAMFLDGPHQGNVVTADKGDDGFPPRRLRPTEGLFYDRANRMKVRALDAEGVLQTYRGIGYRVDRNCPFMVELRAQLAEQAAKKGLAQ